MPDWVPVDVQIYGPKEELEKLEAYFAPAEGTYDGYTLFSQILPTPPDVEDPIQWRIDNWGSIKDFFFEIDYASDQEMSLRGKATWQPHIAGFQAVANMFPKLEIIMSIWTREEWILTAEEGDTK